jgi:tetratricopeptide (TPR) repeat protein
VYTADFSPKIHWIILLILVGVLLALAPEPTDTTAVKAFQQGRLLAISSTQGKAAVDLGLQGIRSSRQKTEAVYRVVISRRPFDPQPWHQLGDLYATWDRPDDALHSFGQAIRRGDTTATLDRSLAQLYSLLGDARQAIYHWDTYLAYRPDDRSARLDRAWAAMGLADWKRAHADLEQLLTFAPDDPIIHAWLGLLLIDADPLAGLSHLERAAEDSRLDTLFAPIFTAQRLSAAIDAPAYRSALLGIAFLDLDVAALGAISEPDSGTHYQAVEGRQKAITTLALRSLLAAIYRNPAYADAYAYLGQAFDQLGRSSWAEASLKYAFKLAPQSPIVQTLMGLFWDRRGAAALARHYYEAAYTQDKENASLCLEIAGTYAAEGRYTAAEVWLLYAADIAPNDSQVWQTLTHFYLDFGIGVEESGLAAAQRLLELLPDDARAHDLMGWAYFLAGEGDQASASLTQALKLDPTLASAHFHLGRLHARQGHHAEASEEYLQTTDFDVRRQFTKELERAWNELPEAYRSEP